MNSRGHIIYGGSASSNMIAKIISSNQRCFNLNKVKNPSAHLQKKYGDGSTPIDDSYWRMKPPPQKWDGGEYVKQREQGKQPKDKFDTPHIEIPNPQFIRLTPQLVIPASNLQLQSQIPTTLNPIPTQRETIEIPNPPKPKPKPKPKQPKPKPKTSLPKNYDYVENASVPKFVNYFRTKVISGDYDDMIEHIEDFEVEVNNAGADIDDKVIEFARKGKTYPPIDVAEIEDMTEQFLTLYNGYKTLLNELAKYEVENNISNPKSQSLISDLMSASYTGIYDGLMKYRSFETYYINIGKKYGKFKNL